MSEKIVTINHEDFERIKKIVEEKKIKYKVVKSSETNIKYPNLGSKEIVKIKNDYQLKNSRYYLGSAYLYRENLYFIRQYPDYKKVLQNGESAPVENVPVKTGLISKPTERDAIRNVNISEAQKKIQIIEDAISTIPEPYQKGVFDHVVYQTAYCDKIYHYANINTWKRWTQKFVYEVAVRRGQKDFIEALRNRK